MAKKDRLEKIRKVRSFNDILDLIKEIGADVMADGKIVRKMGVSLSASKDETIELRHGGIEKPKRTGPRKISTRRNQLGSSFKVRLEKFVSPPKTAIEKNLGVVQRLYDNAKELDALEALLTQGFSQTKNKNAALAGVRALKKEVEQSINAALSALNGIAKKHLPTELEQMRDVLTEFLLDNIPEKDYTDIGYLEYVSLPNKDSIMFSVYVEIEDLKNNNGYVFDEYFVILTGVIDLRNGTMAYHINALPDFRVPGKYDLGYAVETETEMEHRVSMLLAHNDVITQMDRRPMPIEKDDQHSQHFLGINGVVGVDVRDDALYLQVEKPDPKTINRIVSTVLPLLNQSIGRKKDTSISWKQVTRGGKKYLKFILYFKPDQRAKQVNTGILDDIRNLFDLDDKQVSALRRSLLD